MEKINQRYLRWIIIFLQKYVHLLTAAVYKKILHITYLLPREYEHLLPGRYLIVANHIQRRDPFDILSTLPYAAYSQLLPIRFFTANRYMHYWWQRNILSLWGCFYAYSIHSRISGVKGGLYLSDSLDTLFIFPQGKRHTEGSVQQIKIGVGYMTKRRDFTILPCFLRKQKNNYIMITWGVPFRLAKSIRKQSEENITNYIFNRVLSLDKHE